MPIFPFKEVKTSDTNHLDSVCIASAYERCGNVDDFFSAFLNFFYRDYGINDPQNCKRREEIQRLSVSKNICHLNLATTFKGFG